jgi:TonB family protein
MASIAFAVSLALAQDVSVSPLEWTDPAHAPDELPTFRKALSESYPDELRKSAEYGYLYYEAVVDEKGNVAGLYPRGSLPSLVREYESVRQRVRFTPARREGKPVNAAVSFALVFNPAGAPAKGPDAMPRLLQPALVHVRGSDLPSTPTYETSNVILAEATVSAEGRITELRNVPARWQHAAEVSAKNWLFAPARHGGQAVAATVRVPMILAARYEEPKGKNRVQPKVVDRSPPEYPMAMRYSGIRGEVLVDFVVDIEGRTRNVFVLRSLNPAFDDSAVEAVRKWRFEPARVDGVPVNTHMQVPVVFQLTDTPEGGTSGIEIVKRGDLSKLPPEFQYDVEPRIRASARPVYPYTALAEKREGSADVAFIIDLQGRVIKPTVVKATSPEFGQALVAAVERFVYEPALKNGKPCLGSMVFRQDFDRSRTTGLVAEEELDMLRREQKKPQSILGAGEMDEKLKPVSIAPPEFPMWVMDKHSMGDATVEFIVDEEGRVRLPRIVSASDPAFGYAAIQAVARWRFEPPTHGGKFIAVRAQLPLKFKAKDPAPVAEPTAAPKP